MEWGLLYTRNVTVQVDACTLPESIQSKADISTCFIDEFHGLNRGQSLHHPKHQALPDINRAAHLECMQSNVRYSLQLVTDELEWAMGAITDHHLRPEDSMSRKRLAYQVV